MKNQLTALDNAPADPRGPAPAPREPGRLQGAALYFATLALAIAALPGLTGCADMSGIAPSAQMRDAASLGLGQSGAAPAPGTLQVDAAVPADWWRGFSDAQLDALIDRALANSPNLKLAEARVARANAFTETARAATGPHLNGSLDVNRQRYSANGPYPPPLAGGTLMCGTARLTGSWEIDFFGEHRAALQSALGTANAAQAEAQSARLLLASNVARSYIQLARQQAQLAVAERALAQRGETLRLVQDRVAAGLDTQLEQRRAKAACPRRASRSRCCANRSP